MEFVELVVRKRVRNGLDVIEATVVFLSVVLTPLSLQQLARCWNA